MDWNGWDVLFCSYFASVCEASLSEILEKEGFIFSRSTESGRTFFSQDKFELKISYLIESAPNYELLISLYEKPKENSLNENYSRSIPYWFLIENVALMDELARLTFSSEKELYHALLRIYNEAILVYMKPVWINPNLFNEKYEAFQRFNQTL